MDIIAKTVRLRAESKTVTFNELGVEADDPQSLAELLLQVREWATAANQTAKLISDVLAPMLTGAPVTVFDTFVYYGETKTEKCVDTQGFLEWLYDNPDYLEVILNPDTVRKGQLPQAVRETFFEKRTSGKVEIHAVPVELIGGNK